MKLLAMIATFTFAFSQASQAEASLARAAARAAIKRVLPSQSAVRATNAATRAELGAASFTKPRDVLVPRSRYPQSAAHIDHAQRMGQPTVLTLDRASAAERRRASLQHIKRRSDRTIAGKDRDEYPPALTREGGFNSNVRYIDSGDNRGSGKAIERQVRDLPDGSRIRILVSR